MPLVSLGSSAMDTMVRCAESEMGESGSGKGERECEKGEFSLSPFPERERRGEMI